MLLIFHILTSHFSLKKIEVRQEVKRSIKSSTKVIVFFIVLLFPEILFDRERERERERERWQRNNFSAGSLRLASFRRSPIFTV